MCKCEVCQNDMDDFIEINKIDGVEFVERNYKLKFKKVNVCIDCVKKLSCVKCGSKNIEFLDEMNQGFRFIHKQDALVKCPNCNQIKKFRHICQFSCYPKIRNYFYQPLLKFHGDENLYFGIELEVGGAPYKISILKLIKEMQEKSDFFYFKKDGSIARHGVEIVTHPANYNYHKNENHWKNLFEVLKKNNINESNSCGLHIHVNRNKLDKKQISCIDAFVNSNEEFVSNIAGRHFNHYCKRVNKSINDWGSEDDCDRYTSLNLTCRETIEYRMFASTCDYEIFMKRLKFAKDLTLFCKNIELKDVFKRNIIEKFQEFSNSLD